MSPTGFNCSLPHKQVVIERLDGLAESARLIGSVNCIVRRDGRWIGENTDGQGFLASLRDITNAGQRVILLGSGGAARAIAVELAGAAAITVVNRTVAPAEALADLIRSAAATKVDVAARTDTYIVPEDPDILVNATSVGLAPNVDAHLDLDPDTTREELMVCDVIPNPADTALLGDDRKRGARAPSTAAGCW